uniref:diphosphoinositol-polyphosphate diphosphatase n=18 Tax=Neognathae TaxID=8825 RepID=A0A8B9TN08_ANAPL
RAGGEAEAWWRCLRRGGGGEAILEAELRRLRSGRTAKRQGAAAASRLPRPAALRRLRSVPQDGVAVVVGGGGGGRSVGGGFGGAAASDGRDEAAERRQRVAAGSRPAGERDSESERLRGEAGPWPYSPPPPPPNPGLPRPPLTGAPAAPSRPLQGLAAPPAAPLQPPERRMMKLKSNQTRTYDGDGYKKRAACLCFRSESEEEVLLVSSSRHPDRWIVPGGGMEPEEEPNVAAVREVCEEAGVKGTLGRLVGIFENRDRKHRTYVYVLIVTEVLEDWEDSVNIGRKREWFKIEDAIKVLQYHKPVQASYFETLRQGCLANNGTPVMTTTYSESSVSDIR